MAQIVSIHSFRGGTGKSNITANLAATAALKGRRVGLVDTDVQCPGIHVLFGLDEDQVDRALNDYLWGKCAIEETAYDVVPRLPMGSDEIIAAGGGIYLVPASLKAGEITRVLREGYDVGLLNDGFRAFISHFDLDYLLIDTHPGLNEETLLSIAISDVLIILLRPDQQDYQGTAVTVDVARRLDVPRLYLVVNKALPSFDLVALEQRVEDTYNCPVAAVLSLSEDVVRTASSEIFCLRYPDHAFSRGIARIARRVLRVG